MSLLCKSSASMLCDLMWCVRACTFCVCVFVPECDWFSVHICSLSFIRRTRLQPQPAGGNASYLKKSEPHQVSKWRRGRMRARRGREGGGEGARGTETEAKRERKWQGRQESKKGRKLRKSGENGEREMLREDGRGGVREPQSAAKTRKVSGSRRGRDGNLERWETRVSEQDMKERRK